VTLVSLMTDMSYEEVVHEQGIEDILARLEKKRISKGGNPDESPLGKKTGRAMKAQQDKARKKAGVSEGYGKKKKKHDCASKVKHEEYGIGNCIPEMHDLDESGKVSHYDVEFEEYIVEGVPVGELEILEGHMHEHVIREKMAAKDYDGDGKIESGKDEYFGSKDKAIKKAMGKKVKKESLSDWRDDLSDLIEVVAEPEEKAEKEVVEKKVKNKVVINPKFTEAVEEMGGELLEMEVVKKELKDLKKGAETLKGKNIAKADKVEEGKNCGCGQNPCVTYGTDNSVMSEAERKLADRLARKRKVYDKTTKKAMQFARDEGEASGHARYRMSSISREMDGIKAKMNKEG